MPRVSISTTSKQVAYANQKRQSVTFTNEHATAKLYFRSFHYYKEPVSSTDYEYLVGPGLALSFNVAEDDPQVVKGAWVGISDTASMNMGVGET